MKNAGYNITPFDLTVPEELTETIIQRIKENIVGVFVVSYFANLKYTGSLAIEAGNIKSGLLRLSKLLESSYFFRYKITATEEESIRLRDTIRNAIIIRKLGD